MASNTLMTTWLPVIGILISLMTLALTFMKFGRQVTLEDNQAIQAELARSRERVKELLKAYEEAIKENQQLKEHNYQLMSQLTKLRNG